MSRGVILVRHAMPQVMPGTSSSLWTLGESAKEDCVLLAHALSADIAAVVYSSPEPKASETATVIALRLGLQVQTDARFSEVDRPPVWDENYRAMVLNYLECGEQAGWEPVEAVRKRFAAAVDEALTAHPSGDVIISNHGMALSLFAASHATVNLAEFWSNLTFPDAWRLDLGSGALEHLYDGGLPPD